MKEIVGGQNLPAVSPIPAVLLVLVYVGWLVYVYKRRSLLSRPFMSAVFPLCFVAITMLYVCVLTFFVLDSPYIPPAIGLAPNLGNLIREIVAVIGGVFGVAFLVTGKRLKDRIPGLLRGG